MLKVVLSNSTKVVFHRTHIPVLFLLCKLWHDLLLHNRKTLQQHWKSESGLTTNTPKSTQI